jgi:hypothetical protein
MTPTGTHESPKDVAEVRRNDGPAARAFAFVDQLNESLRRSTHWVKEQIPGNAAQLRKDVTSAFGPNLHRLVIVLDWLHEHKRDKDVIRILSLLCGRYDMDIMPKLSVQTVNTFTAESFEASCAWADWQKAQQAWKDDPTDENALSVYHAFVVMQRESHDVVTAVSEGRL